MTLSDKEISPSWRSNQLLTGDKTSTNFSPLSWSNGGARAGFTKWEAQNVKLLEPAEEIDIVTEASEQLEEVLDIIKEDGAESEAEALTVSMAVFDQATQEFFEKGYSRGVEEAERKWERTRETFSTLTQSMYQEQQKATTFFEPIKTLSLHIAQQLVRGELSISNVAIERLIRGVLEELQQKGPAPIVITLNPQDLEQVCLNLAEDLAHLDLRKSDNLSPGSVVLTLDNSAVEDLIEHRLEVLSESLFTAVSTDNMSTSNTNEDLSGKEEGKSQRQESESHLANDPEKPRDEGQDE
jgi:flagellar biosynthesis/type III secretory pathway protein FliH